MGIFNNELFQLLSAILPVIIPVIGAIITWFVSKNQDVFNSKKIQKYYLSDYQDTVFLYQAFFSILNPVIFLMGFAVALNVAAKIDVTYYVQLVYLIIVYVGLLMIVIVAEFEILFRKKEKLRIISDSINEEFSKMMLSTDNKKNLVYNINMFFFSAIWIIIFCPLNTKIIYVVISFWIIYYIISMLYMISRSSKYRTKAKIKSKTIIRMDYRKDYGCYCNIILKKDFSFKFQDDKIVIYYPGDISSYTIKQDELDSIAIGYRIEYPSDSDNKK